MVLYSTILNEEKHCELVKEKEFDYNSKIVNNRDVEEILRNVFKADKLPEEHAWMFCLN